MTTGDRTGFKRTVTFYAVELKKSLRELVRGVGKTKQWKLLRRLGGWGALCEIKIEVIRRRKLAYKKLRHKYKKIVNKNVREGRHRRLDGFNKMAAS
jgi:hypothetical protein